MDSLEVMAVVESSEVEKKEEFVPIPISGMKWKSIDDHVLNTPLGVDECRVDVLDSDEYRILKPGEDTRIRKIQARLFCEWIIGTRGTILGPQLKYLLELFEISQAVLAESMQLSPSAISQLVSGKNTPSHQTSREIAVLFRLEATAPGFLAALADNKWPIRDVCAA